MINIAQVGIIADDLTGANAAAVLMRQKGFTAVTALDIDAADQTIRRQAAICISTDSRALHSSEAYKKVKTASQMLKDLGCQLICKRIDTTLRGNIGRETDGVLDFAGGEYKAIVVASYPSSGRICIGGHILVNSLPLDETAVAKDPKAPVTSSKVETIIKAQSARDVKYIPFEAVRSAQEVLVKMIDDIPSGAIGIIDAVTDEDITKIAGCCIQAHSAIIPVDPGPFSAAMAAELYDRKTPRPPVLMVVGSTTELTRRQIKYLSNAYKTHWIRISPTALFNSPAEEEINKVYEEAVSAFNRYTLIGITTAISDTDLISNGEWARWGINSAEEFYNRLNKYIGHIASEILLHKPDIAALYTSGGDITRSVCDSLGAWGINIEGQVIPLAVFGRLSGGKFTGLPIVTKGGLIGTDETLKACIDYIYNKIS